LDTLVLGRAHPGPGGYIRNGVVVARKIAAFRQPLVEHAVEPLRLLAVALATVRNFDRRIAQEMMRLPQHGAQAAHLPQQPLEGDVAPLLVRRREASMLVCEVGQYRAGLEEG